jgi:SAM-dependent methyltransferase
VSSTGDHWDARYGAADYVYGTQPNDFLREQAATLPPRGRVLCIGEGEGRNAVFLAGLGHDVVALDASAVGLAKAARLAGQQGVRISTVHADLADFEFGAHAWDGIVSIWCHLALPLRARVYRDAVRALRPGGVFVLEAYTAEQLRLGTGGPKSLELLPSLAVLRTELPGLELLIAIERERDVREGSGHGGRSAVVQILGRRDA